MARGNGNYLADAIIEPLVEGAMFDPALRAPSRVLRALTRKRIQAHKISSNQSVESARSSHRADSKAMRAALFEAAAEGRPILLSSVPVPVAGEEELGIRQALLKAIGRAFRSHKTASAQVGRKGVRRHLPIPELLRRWKSGRSVVSITDLHVRNTRLERDICTDKLSDFNELPRGSENMRRQEMMTLVVSSRGNVTDSHSDDPDGSNHCFVGRKLWLAWETFEGRKAGLQDCSRDLISERAHFDLPAFARLRSAKWWTVSPGETLFLPGRLSHRVITLESYIGIGSFYCTPASSLENLSRWYRHGPLWSLDDPEAANENLVDEIATALTRRLRRLAKGTPRSQDRWGLGFSALSLQRWERRWTQSQRRMLMTKHPQFAELVDQLKVLARVVG